MSHVRHGSRTRRLACALALGALAATATPAAAQEPPPEPLDPQTTNIPSTAWAGTQLRFVKCTPDLEEIDRRGVFAEVESWSGDPGYRPAVVQQSIAFFRDDDEEATRCVRFNAVTLGDGLARIKLKVFEGPDRIELFEHQFLAAWLRLETPSLEDPAGDAPLVPSSDNRRLDVRLTGSFPHPLGPGGRFTLPDAWPTLAGALAREYDDSSENPALRWDIHGADAPDSAGPFDPLRRATLLSDGTLDADDAPMPAARVDVRIAPNEEGGIGGAGALEKADKGDTLAGPFSVQWIPATSAEQEEPAASGTDWFLQNNFPRAWYGAYDNWDTVPLTTAVAADTACNRTVGFDAGAEDEPRQTPAGDQRVTVYTDEHGQAQVELAPYAGGFHYDAVGAVPNRNGGCDLQDVETLGEASLTATARYPAQPTDFPEPASDALTKAIGNEFDKSLSYYPKGEGEENDGARIVVAHGQDVDGTPFAGERVCFYVGGDAGSRLFSGEVGPEASPFEVTTEPVPTPAGIDPDALCARLDAGGNAALEVLSGDGESVSVIADYLDEGLLRRRAVDFGTPGSGDSEPPPGTGGGTDGGSTAPGGQGTTAPTRRQVVETVGQADAAPLLRSTQKARAGRRGARARIAASRVVRTRSGRFLVVKVRSSDRRTRVAVRMRLRGGTVRRATRTVRTNRSVRVMRLSRSVTTVRVRLAR